MSTDRDFCSTALPAKGYDKQQILSEMDGLRRNDADWRNARTWSLVYSAGEEHTKFLKEAHNKFFSENGLNPMAFKSLKRMESDVVSMIGGLFNGPESVVGTLNSGGTESILLAIKTYRNRARKLKPWIRSPEVVIPVTAHPAFDKAAHYFGVKLKKAPVMSDFRADVKAMKKLIGRNTVALVGSAPHYPQGVIDPLEELSDLALAHKLPLHVDACVGGLMLPWVERMGRPVALWDFRVPGVTSISADLHKYGYSAKGASVLVYRSMEYMRSQFFIYADWTGGVYASANIPGTRPGGPMAAAWAALLALGEEGYMDLTKRALSVRDRMIDGIAEIDELEVFGDPVGTLVSYGSNTDRVGIFAVADELEKRGWQFDRHQNPNCIHCTCAANHEPVVDEYLRDLKAAVAHVRANPQLNDEGNAAMYGMMAKVPVRGLVRYSVQRVMESMYAPGAGDPDLAGSRADDPILSKLEAYGGKALQTLEKAKEAVSGVLGKSGD